MAPRGGLSLANSMECNRLVVNSDCMEVMEIMTNGGHSVGPMAATYNDCFFLFHDYSDISFKFSYFILEKPIWQQCFS